jgi:hypothetical protein
MFCLNWMATSVLPISVWARRPLMWPFFNHTLHVVRRPILLLRFWWVDRMEKVSTTGLSEF